jgi:hypothetical protein
LIYTPLNVGVIMERFHTANSLETLQRLVEPFAPSSTVALSHLLQILAWGMAGYLVGGMVKRGWMDERGMLGRVICLVIGVVLLVAGNLWVPVWLELRLSDEVMAQVRLAVMDSLFAISVVALLDGCRRLFDLPLPAKQRRKAKARKEPAGQGVSKSPRFLPLSRGVSESVPSDQDDDIIMLELD